MDNYQIIEPENRGVKLAQTAIFKQLWILSDKKSFVSGLYLREFMDSPFFFNCFAHVLAKGQNQYPYFKFYGRNIALLTPGEHSLWDHGTEEQRIAYALDMEEKTHGKAKVDWKRLEALRDDLKEEYTKVFPTRKGLIIGYKYSPEEQISIIGPLNAKYWKELEENNGRQRNLSQGQDQAQ